MGLERLACVMQGAANLFETDTVRSILNHVEKLSGKTYGKDHATDVSIRVITDHIRSTTFMVSDGILPSNEGRGYVLRRLLRRAARHGRMLGITRPFLTEVCETVIAQNESAYPELREKENFIKKTIAAEEERFSRTIDQGLSRLNELMDNIAKAAAQGKEKILSGIEAFRLNDTYGFPLDLTREIAEEAGIKVDIEMFKKELQKQREKAKQDRMSKDISGWEADMFAALDVAATEFTGYGSLKEQTVVLALCENEELLDAVAMDDLPKEGVLVILDKTPFYAEGGGQVADTGMLTGGDIRLQVEGVKKTGKGYYVHYCTLLSGTVHKGDVLLAQVDQERRASIMRNHTSLHLLQAALREVLGEHVHQAGSYVDDRHARFDFTHFSALTSKEIMEVEKLVNRKIFEAIPLKVETMSLDEAKKMGAMALFGEKYGERVRVVDVAGWSIEFCGGTHVQNTAQLGLFKILNESSVAAGVRRIEGTTGYGVLELILEKDVLIQETAANLKAANVAELPARAQAVTGEVKRLEKELASMKDSHAQGQMEDLFKNAAEVDGIKIITVFFGGVAPDALRNICDKIREKAPNAVAAVSGESGGKVTLAVCCGEKAQERGLKAGQLVKEIAAVAGGSGGGKPDFAMAGIKDKTKIDEALDATAQIVKNMMYNQ